MTDKKDTIGRRGFMGGALGAAAGAGVASLLGQGQANAQPPAGAGGPPPDISPNFVRPASSFKLEATIYDCDVEGEIPSDLNGAFYRVGPDPQYPLAPGNIPFDGEGHASMFRIKDGRVDYRTRMVKNERWLAQNEAGRILFPMYRNPSMDDPSVRGLSRSTANTHIINHRNYLLALKEDSPPSALDLLTLETVVPNYTFDDQLPSRTFTAHPKVDSETGNIVAFGYEAEGHGSDVVSMFEINPAGEIVWNAKIRVPYVGLLHDFAVTQHYIVFYVIPLEFDQNQMDAGGIHWAWNGNRPTYFGFFPRGSENPDDVRWIAGPTRSATHVMGAFSDSERLYVDVEMSEGNPFPFMPHNDGTSWSPQTGSSHITRLSVDLSRRRPRDYGIEQLYPHVGALPRQDDRYNTVPYRYGFLNCPNPHVEGRGGATLTRFDHQTRTDTYFDFGTSASLAEACFAPRSATAREGEGYLMAVKTNNDENGRGDLVIMDAEHLADGPVATVRLPIRAVGQVHGWWVPEAQLPTA